MTAVVAPSRTRQRSKRRTSSLLARRGGYGALGYVGSASLAQLADPLAQLLALSIMPVHSSNSSSSSAHTDQVVGRRLFLGRWNATLRIASQDLPAIGAVMSSGQAQNCHNFLGNDRSPVLSI